MSWAIVIAIHLVVGAVLAWRARCAGRASTASTILTFLVWPLWAPFVLEGPRRRVVAREDDLLAAIEDARTASAEASMQALFSDAMAARLAADVLRARERIDALARTLDTPALVTPSAVTSGRSATDAMHAESVAALRALLEAERHRLEELRSLLRALRSQLALARFTGTAGEDLSGIVQEVWARVEGLGAALRPDVEESMPSDAPLPADEETPRAPGPPHHHDGPHVEPCP